jgi:hypothetical protein
MLVEGGNLAVVMPAVEAVLVVREALQVLGLPVMVALEFHHLYLERKFNTLAVAAVAFLQIT